MLLGLLEQPEQFVDHIKRFTTSLTMQIIYGVRIVSEEDPLLKSLFHFFDRFSDISLSLTAILLDTFPVLRYIPSILLPRKKEAEVLHKKEHAIFLSLYLGMKQKMLEGKAPTCFAHDLARVQAQEGMSDDDAAYTIGSLLQGGLGSTTETLTGFVKAMALFPDVVKAAQVELDRVCGDRLPSLDNWSELVYTRGCLKEALRWMPVSPIGIPHALTRDDDYMGYYLPRGATVIYNVRAIHKDPDRFPRPEIFDPNRWATDTQTAAQAATNADVRQRDHFMFGAGRRLCQGIHIAERSLFLAISRILWAFDIRPAVDPDTGRQIPIPDADDLQGGIFVMPRPFRTTIVPRSDLKARLIRNAWDDAAQSSLDESLQWKVGLNTT
jgi:cytochrome P450